MSPPQLLLRMTTPTRTIFSLKKFITLCRKTYLTAANVNIKLKNKTNLKAKDGF
jgi:hypothetical protein